MRSRELTAGQVRPPKSQSRYNTTVQSPLLPSTAPADPLPALAGADGIVASLAPAAAAPAVAAVAAGGVPGSVVAAAEDGDGILLSTIDAPSVFTVVSIAVAGAAVAAVGAAVVGRPAGGLFEADSLAEDWNTCRMCVCVLWEVVRVLAGFWLVFDGAIYIKGREERLFR